MSVTVYIKSFTSLSQGKIYLKEEGEKMQN